MPPKNARKIDGPGVIEEDRRGGILRRPIMGGTPADRPSFDSEEEKSRCGC
jgi:hypothetical protein